MNTSFCPISDFGTEKGARLQRNSFRSGSGRTPPVAPSEQVS